MQIGSYTIKNVFIVPMIGFHSLQPMIITIMTNGEDENDVCMHEVIREITSLVRPFSFSFRLQY